MEGEQPARHRQHCARVRRRRRAAWAASSAVHGALMRAIPLAICFAFAPLAVIVDAAASDARLTHPNLICVAANVAYVAALATLIASASHCGVVDLAARQAAARESAEAALAELAAPSEGSDELDLVAHWIAKALDDEPESQLVFNASVRRLGGHVRCGFVLAFRTLADPEPEYVATVEAVLALGGDTDTNAAIAGGMVGALVGHCGLPHAMVATVRKCRPKTRPKWLHAAQADGMLASLTSSWPERRDKSP